ncbi:putative repeat protein (TIGR01451 family) [Sphingomonas endophytica]|uniref:Putative repeat protein (TIGR01451 family) n=1 Tax=Sphingomonas endophytica TaxID=869719 RepID=A0A7X0MLL8_9SPHN|nr:DUF11 domain-containing protein [Sphingomonas endophytica]MBB6503374.1 putative repeat protein (TIGR01451 family) [Sphingomonas endophytica]
MPVARARSLLAIAHALVIAALCLFAALPATAQTVRIANTAQLSFGAPDARATVASNTVTLDVDRTRRPTALSFRLPPIGFQFSGMRCDTVPELRFSPAPIDAADLARAAPLRTIDTRQPMIIVLDAPGDNHDPAKRETDYIDVDTDRGVFKLPLFETGENTGVFAGGVPRGGEHAELSACDPTRSRTPKLRMSFAGNEFSDASEAMLLVDPAGYVFDSMTGALIDGAEVSLLDANGNLATVYGDDGMSAYPATVISGGSARDASGRLYPFTAGNYRFPLVAPGTYHLRIVPPGNYAAPSTRDRSALAGLRDPGGKPFLINDASFGAAFTIDSPEPFYSDIPLDRSGETILLLTKTASTREASPGDVVQYRVTVTNRSDAPARNVAVTDLLPAGLRYQPDSTRGVAEPVRGSDAHKLDFVIPMIAPRGTAELRYTVTIAMGAKAGETVNRVLASGSAGVTGNEAAAAIRVRPLLFSDGFTVIGRVTEGACGDPAQGRRGVRGIRLLLEDGTFVVTDKDGLYHFEGVRAGRHVVALDRASVPASHEPVACDADTRQAGSATSRFVESDGGLLKRVDFQLRPTGRTAAADAALPVPVRSDGAAAGAGRDWFVGETPGTAFLFPTADHNPRAPAIRVVIKHHPGQRVALTVNGVATDPLAFDGTDTDAAGAIAVARWSGVPVVPGDNRLVARVLDADGRVATTLTQVVHYAGAAVQVVAVADKSRLVADGLTRPLLALRATDAQGRPVRAGTLLTVRVAAPYAVAEEIAIAQERRQIANGEAHSARVVGDDGYAFVALEPTMQSGQVRAQIDLADRDTRRTIDVTGWLAAPARGLTVVGFGAGTLGFDTLRRHGEPLAPGRWVRDGQLAFYAKGRIKGAWLATLAYDSDRQRDHTRGLLGTIDPDRYYTVYGDGTRQGYDAPTDRKLYLRLERRDVYALFGDYETGLTATRLGRYSRTLNGVKAEYDGRRLLFSAFAAHTDERYARDEIPGNGLSGPYRLAARDIVPNSDKLRIEVRDRFRPERVVTTTPMTRHIDYDIDTGAGTIRFREPVLTRDPSLNPVVIVVDYETYGRGRKKVAGGRGAVRLAGGKVEVGATALHDETTTTADLLAVDLRARLTATTELRAEAASGGRGGLDTGRAWLAEAEHHGPRADVLVYARQQDRDFGVSQQNVVEAGARRVGVDSRVQLAPRVSLIATGWHQQQLDGPETRTALDTRLEFRRDRGTLFAGTQLARDRGVTGRDRTSQLLTLGGTQSVLDGKLTLTGQTQFAPGGDTDSRDFPARHQLLAGYRLTPNVRLIGGYEVAQGAGHDAKTARLGFDVAPWTGGKLLTTLNQQASGSEDAPRLFAQYGLSQSLPIGARWIVDASLDASTTLRGHADPATALNAFGALAPGITVQDNGGGDYAAITMGASYRAPRWSWNGRGEYRASAQGNRFGLTTNLLRPLGEGRSLALGVRWYGVGNASSLTADAALAWRPIDSRWSILERLQWRDDRAGAGITAANVLGVAAGGDLFQATRRAINNIAVNYRSGAEGDGHGLEMTLYHGVKWVRGSFGGDDYTGLTQIVGAEVRRDLGAHVDLGVQGSVQHGITSRTLAFSAGPNIGVSPVRDLWISAGYNVSGYRDRDLAQDRYTRRGPFVTLRLKLDRNAAPR